MVLVDLATELTDSRLERAINEAAGKCACRAAPLGRGTERRFRPIGLVVETDGLRNHRTPAAQTRSGCVIRHIPRLG